MTGRMLARGHQEPPGPRERASGQESEPRVAEHMAMSLTFSRYASACRTTGMTSRSGIVAATLLLL
jgi:hypothetical protein